MPDPERWFATCVDGRHEAAASAVLRYRHAVRLEESDEADEQVKEALRRTSIREGLRIVPLLDYRGVHVDVLDETSLMHTNSLKAIDGAVSIAKCLAQGVKEIVVESGGNTATALAAYGAPSGVAVTCFVPEENIGLLDGDVFRNPLVRLVAVADPALVKPAALRFAQQSGALNAPEVGWRFQASRFVGCFLRESFLGGAHYDWMAQTISAAFGPIGIYSALDDGATAASPAAASDSPAPTPRFLGVQQSANCPMYRAWTGQGSGPERAALHSTRGLLTPVMYDGASSEYGTYPRLEALLVRTRGDLTTIDAHEFGRAVDPAFESDVLRALQRQAIEISMRNGEVVEKTGLIAIAGVIKAIRAGQISPGSRVLACLTSGVRRDAATAVPQARLSDPASLGAISKSDG